MMAAAGLGAGAEAGAGASEREYFDMVAGLVTQAGHDVEAVVTVLPLIINSPITRASLSGRRAGCAAAGSARLRRKAQNTSLVL